MIRNSSLAQPELTKNNNNKPWMAHHHYVLIHPEPKMNQRITCQLFHFNPLTVRLHVSYFILIP